MISKSKMCYPCSIFVRHLEFVRDEPFLKAMETFVKTTLGNGYNISLKNLIFRRKSMKNIRQSEAQAVDDID